MFLQKTIFEKKKLFCRSNFENVFWMLEQPVNNKGFSRIQFLLGEFYQKYKKVLLSFSRLEILKKFYKLFWGKKVPFFEI